MCTKLFANVGIFVQDRFQLVPEQKFQIFSAAGYLVFVAIDILGLITRTKSGNQHLDIKTYEFSKPTLAFSTAKINSMQTAIIFLNHSVMPYEMPLYALTDSGPQSVSWFLTTIFVFLGVKNLTTAAFRSQRNGQVNYIITP